MAIQIEKNDRYVHIKIDDTVFIHSQVMEFNTIITELKAQSISRFIVDLLRCDYISSDGLGAIAELWRWCNDGGNGTFAILFSEDPNNEIRYLFDIIGLSLAMKGHIFGDLKSAEAFMLNA